MGFLDWLSHKLDSTGGNVSLDDAILCEKDTIKRLAMKEYALELCIDFVARMVASAEIKVKENGVYKRNKLYYRLNIEANHNQTSFTMWENMVRKLLHEGEAVIVPIEHRNIDTTMLYLADEVTKKNRSLIESRYEDVKIGDYLLQKRNKKTVFKEEEVYSFQYDNEEIRSEFAQLSRGMEEILDAVQSQYVMKKYVKSVIESPGIVNQTKEQDDKRQQVFRERLREFLNAEKNVVMVLQNQQKIGRFESVMGDGNIDDAVNIQNMMDDIVKRTASVFHIPVQALYGETVDLTGWITTFLKPFVQNIAFEISRKYFGEEAYKSNTYVEFDLTGLIVQTELDRAKTLDLFLRSGTHSINENREILGEEPIHKDWANRHFMTLNYDFIERFVEGEQGSRGTNKNAGTSNNTGINSPTDGDDALDNDTQDGEE